MQIKCPGTARLRVCVTLCAKIRLLENSHFPRITHSVLPKRDVQVGNQHPAFLPKYSKTISLDLCAVNRSNVFIALRAFFHVQWSQE